MMMRADIIIGTSGVPHGFVCFGTNSWVTSIQTTLFTRWVVMVVGMVEVLDKNVHNYNQFIFEFILLVILILFVISILVQVQTLDGFQTVNWKSCPSNLSLNHV